ncbi:hypothetical protein KIN20_031440 [Parelaphostrongylus tenuis]|uniref:Uncharacterized protein n=1 Tax=Parelaphostrongylus tenuis TaxID=148309 RepID=A0AAD5R5K3_PARTN|nr:hypothetical protein KIN20_031440 [Parelaphostrongylus tenuis]
MRSEKEEIAKNAKRKGKEDSQENWDNIEKQYDANDSVNQLRAENADNSVSAPLDRQHSTQSGRENSRIKEVIAFS